MGVTQPPARETEAVDNSPRYWASERSGIVHRTVRWAPCGARRARFIATTDFIPSGPRCRTCFPTSEVPRKTSATGWPK